MFFFHPPLTNEIVPAKIEAATLSREMAKTVELENGLQDDFVYVVPHGTSPAVQLQGLALALHGTLTPTPFGFRIARTPDDRKSLLGDRRKQRVKWFESRLTGIEAFRSSHSKAFGSPDVLGEVIRAEDQRLQEIASGKRPGSQIPPFFLFQIMPSETLLEGMIKSIGVDHLASLPSGSVETYEDQPIVDAKPLPDDSDLVKSYFKGKDDISGQVLLPALQADISKLRLQDRFSDLQSGRPQPDRFRLSVRAQTDGVSALLEGFDGDGNRVAQATFDARPLGNHVMPRLVLSEEADKPNTRWLDLSTDAASALEYLQSQKGPTPTWLLHPQEHEPLNAFVREVLDALAGDNPDQCVVFNVSDSFFAQVLNSTRKNQVNLEALKRLLAEWDPYSEVDQGGVHVWVPQDLPGDEANRADRNALGRFASTVQSAKTLNLRDLGSLYTDSSRVPGPLLGYWFRWGLAATRTWVEDTSPDLLSFIGSMPDEAWDLLYSGQPQTVARLGASELFQRYLEQASFANVRSAGPYPDIYRHPMEIYPSGVSPQVPIMLSSQRVRVVRVWDADKPEPSYWGDASLLDSEFTIPVTRLNLSSGKPKLTMTQQEYEQSLSKLRFRIGSRPDATLTIGLNRHLFLEEKLRGQETPVSDVLAFADLPQSERDAIWKRAADQASRYGDNVTPRSVNNIGTNPPKPTP